MELSPLSLMLLLIGGILSKHAEEKPKAKVVVKPKEDGSTTVRCEIADVDGDWTYSWFTDGTKRSFSSNREFSITGVSHISSKVTCRGERNHDGLKSDISDAVTLIIPVHTERLKPVLTVKSGTSKISRGDTVTLTCDIQGENWKYSLLCGDKVHDSDEKEFEISVQSTQTCKCFGSRQSGSSDWSDEVTLNASESYKAVLTVQPDLPQILRGDTVILKCDIQGENWKYSLLCGNKEHKSEEKELKITVNSTQTCKCYGSRQSVSSEWSNEVTVTVFDITDKPKISIKPQSSVFTGDTVTLRCDAGRLTAKRIIWYKDSGRIGAGDETKTLTDVRISNGGKYKCGVISAKNVSTQGLDVQLTVTEKPKATVHVQSNGDVFRGQKVTFTCHIPISNVTRWSYSWNKDDSVIQESESQEYRISSVDESHAGLYSCRGRETGGYRHTHTSDQHTLNVSEIPKPVLTVQSELSQILRGYTVTLTCNLKGGNWKYIFHCGDKEHKSDKKEFDISVESTQACKCYGWGQSSSSSKWSNEVNLTVLDPPADHTRLIAVSAGLGALVLLCFILLLLWCCKRKKDVGSLSLSADHQQHNISQTPEEEKRKKQTLRSDSVNDSSDVTYAQIEMKANVETKKKNKDDKENSRETPDTVYSKLKI